MTENDARYCLKLLRDELPDGIDKVLAEDPDVVVLAKELMEEHTLMDEEGVLWVNLEHGLLEGILEVQFGIRLTPGGYEWVGGQCLSGSTI